MEQYQAFKGLILLILGVGQMLIDSCERKKTRLHLSMAVGLTELFPMTIGYTATAALASVAHILPSTLFLPA